MKRSFLSFFFILIVAQLGFSQASAAIVDAYKKNFAQASLNTKVELLKEAKTYSDAEMASLYDMGLRFVVDTYNLLSGDPKLSEIAIISAEMIEQYKYVDSCSNLMALFQIYKENSVRIPIVNALSVVGVEKIDVINFLNDFLMRQNSLYQSGIKPDNGTLEAVIIALGKLGDGNSFSVLFSAYAIGYNDTLTKKANEALSLLKGDYKLYLIEVIKKNPVIEKVQALNAAIQNDNLNNDAKGEIAEAALDIALKYVNPNPTEQGFSRDLRTKAVQVLTNLEWTKASPLAVKCFQIIRTEYARAQVTKASLLEVVAFLGSMGTSEAAETLSSYLEVMNSQTEQSNSFDEQITLAVVNNLGILGDKVAFNHLLYISYLKYTDAIKRAAKVALSKLKM